MLLASFIVLKLILRYHLNDVRLGMPVCPFGVPFPRRFEPPPLGLPAALRGLEAPAAALGLPAP